MHYEYPLYAINGVPILDNWIKRYKSAICVLLERCPVHSRKKYQYVKELKRYYDLLKICKNSPDFYRMFLRDPLLFLETTY